MNNLCAVAEQNIYLRMKNVMKVIGHGIRPVRPTGGSINLFFDVDGDVEVDPWAVHRVNDTNYLLQGALLVVHQRH